MLSLSRLMEFDERRWYMGRSPSFDRCHPEQSGVRRPAVPGAAKGSFAAWPVPLACRWDRTMGVGRVNQLAPLVLPRGGPPE